MKKKALSGMLLLSLLTFLLYVLVVSAVDYLISSSGSYYTNKIIWKTTLNGTAAGDSFGWSVASGDVNNDGYADVIIGAYFADPPGGTNAGQVFVFFGTADGIPEIDAIYANMTLNGTAANDEFGYNLASGDVNNDSYADVIVGAYWMSPSGTSQAGQVFVFFGANYTTSINEAAPAYANITLNGTVASTNFGNSVGSGDVNNDGYADIITGSYATAPAGVTDAGQAFVFFGVDYTSAVNENASEYANITLNGTKISDRFGWSVASGDVNNDSYADVIVGAYYADPPSGANAGQAFVFFGGDISAINYSDALNANITINGTKADDNLGQSVASGDFNNDGYADVMIGAQTEDLGPPDTTYASQAFVFFGANYTTPVNENSLTYANITINNTVGVYFLGNSVASGDVNNDSYDDFIVTAYYADADLGDGTWPGQVFVFFGADYTSAVNENETSIANMTLNGTAASDSFGKDVASGDVNNDSYADVIVGASAADPPGVTDAGIVYIFSFDDVYPVVTLGVPADFYNETGSGFVTFNYTGTDANLGVCELWGNWSGGWHMNESFISPVSGETNGSSNITLEDGLYVWTVYCNDTANNYNNTVENFTLTVDITAPNITLDSPENFFNESATGNVTFNYTASDVFSTGVNSLFEIDTCELWGNWSGGWHLNETFVSPPKDATNGSSNITIVDGLYVWTVYCNDTLGNYNNTVENYTLTVDTTATVVTLDAPSDNSYDTDGDANFSFTAVEPNPDQCTLWFRSNVTNWAQNDSTTYSNNVQTNIFVNLTDAVYVWNVECNDTVNNPAFASANRTVTVDTVVPTTPTVTEPSDTSINPRDSISYTCESSDVTAGISKWTWTLTRPPDGGTVTKTGGAVTSNIQAFSGDDTNLAGSYTVKCEAEDKAGHKSSSSKTFAVYYSHHVEAPSAGPSGAADIDLSTVEEATITEKQGVISTFTLDGTTVHTLKITFVDEAAGTVTIIIESDPIEITLKIGETKEVDVDADGVNDISVTLNGIAKGVADITTKRLTPLPKKEGPQEEVTPTEKPAEEITPEESPSKTWIWILTIVVIIVICIGYYFMKKKGVEPLILEESKPVKGKKSKK